MEKQRAQFINLAAVQNGKGEFWLEHVGPTVAPVGQYKSEARQATPSAMVEFLGADASLITREVLLGQRYCALPFPGRVVQPPQDEIVFAGIVSLPPDASVLRLVLDPAEPASPVVEQRIPQSGPEIEFDWDPAQAALAGRVTMKWHAFHPQKLPMLHTLYRVSDQGEWRTISLPSPDSAAEFDFDELAGGTVSLGVESTDGFNIARAQSPPFDLPLRPAVAIIAAPRDGDQFAADAPVYFDGYGWYRETGEAEKRWLRWRSDLQGDLGPGRGFSVALKPGTHRITLQAGSPGREGEYATTITVGPAPKQ